MEGSIPYGEASGEQLHAKYRSKRLLLTEPTAYEFAGGFLNKTAGSLGVCGFGKIPSRAPFPLLIYHWKAEPLQIRHQASKGQTHPLTVA